MGHKIGKAHVPHKGSLQFYPRVRAKRIYPRIRNWPKVEEVRFLGFAGYKVGMGHAIIIDNRKFSPTRGMEISVPVTILETPPILVWGLRFYKRKPTGLVCKTEVHAEVSKELAKDLGRKIKLPKQSKDVEKTLSEIEAKIDEYSDVRAICVTIPRLTKIKKKPEIFEVAVGGKDVREKLNFLKNFLGKLIRVSDVFKPGEQVDVFAVTKGKGLQGPVKRFGIKLLHHKAKKGRRKPGTLGPERPGKVLFTVPLAGQLGFFSRCEYNKWILDIRNDGGSITPAGGFPHYGILRNDYMVLMGSVPGAKKRLVRLRLALRSNRKLPNVPPKIVSVVT